MPPERPIWGEPDWTATTPSDSCIEFALRSADTEAGIATATPVTPSGSRRPRPPSTSATSSRARVDPTMQFLEVRATLASSLVHEDEPVLREMRLDYTCTTTE